MDITESIAVFWFRRDLRLFDNAALFKALTSGLNVLPVFIFDTRILHNLIRKDKRVCFIHQAIEHMKQLLVPYKTSVQIYVGTPEKGFDQLLLKLLIPFLQVEEVIRPECVN